MVIRPCRFILASVPSAVALAIMTLSGPCPADGPSTGPGGINSQGLGLDGDGIAIGQIESHRPGKHGFDTAAHISSAYDPHKVFTIDGTPDVDFTHIHAVGVAGIMLSDPGRLMSVSPQASLYAATIDHPSAPYAFANWVLAAQRVAQEDGGVVRATNSSVVQPGLALDGQSLITRGMDWSARQHDLLYAQARSNVGLGGAAVPVDLYNGIIIGASKRNGTVYDQVWDGTSEENAVNGRRLTNILAPGSPIATTIYDDPPGTVDWADVDGTSVAAPHVTGTVALLQEFAATEGWTGAAQRHEVMKAVLMNSADKLKDSGDGKRLCMEKDILDKTGDGWLLSDAFGAFTAHPVDDEMGTGQLNAKRALKQFESGQHGPGTVPLIGWDYRTTAAAGDIKKYKLEKPLEADSFFAATLAWDRKVELIDGDLDGQYDSGEFLFDQGHTNMDLYLVPAGGTSIAEAIAGSTTTIYNVEHIFFRVPAEGEYELWVQQANAPLGEQLYAVAWWAKTAPGMCPTDLNDDGVTDGFDLAIILSEWGPNCGHPADLDRNGLVNGLDMAILLGGYGPCTGACCLPPNGSCVAVNNRGECSAQGGSYLGDHTDCAKCRNVTGACCIDNDCSDAMTPGQCASVDGQWLGPGTNCGSPKQCERPLPASCTLSDVVSQCPSSITASFSGSLVYEPPGSYECQFTITYSPITFPAPVSGGVYGVISVRVGYLTTVDLGYFVTGPGEFECLPPIGSGSGTFDAGLHIFCDEDAGQWLAILAPSTQFGASYLVYAGPATLCPQGVYTWTGNCLWPAMYPSAGFLPWPQCPVGTSLELGSVPTIVVE